MMTPFEKKVIEEREDALTILYDKRSLLSDAYDEYHKETKHLEAMLERRNEAESAMTSAIREINEMISELKYGHGAPEDKEEKEDGQRDRSDNCDW